MWERWEEGTGIGMNSHNHGMYASIGAWLYKALAGIRVDRELHRVLERGDRSEGSVPGLKSVDAAIDTVRGPIETSWENAAGGLSLTINVPPGADAEVRFPKLGKPDGRLTEGGTVVAEGGDVRHFRHSQ